MTVAMPRIAAGDRARPGRGRSAGRCPGTWIDAGDRARRRDLGRARVRQRRPRRAGGPGGRSRRETRHGAREEPSELAPARTSSASGPGTTRRGISSRALGRARSRLAGSGARSGRGTCRPQDVAGVRAAASTPPRAARMRRTPPAAADVTLARPTRTPRRARRPRSPDAGPRRARDSTTSARTSSSGPASVDLERAAHPEDCRPSALARASDPGSIAPPGGTPEEPRPSRGAPWIVVKRPGERTRKTGRRRPAAAARTRARSRQAPRPRSNSHAVARGEQGDGGSAAASKSRTEVRPISRQPPGEADGIDAGLALRRSRRCPAGTRGRGVVRRGAASSGGRPVRYAKPGANPTKATRYRAAAWRRANSCGRSPARPARARRDPAPS